MVFLRHYPYALPCLAVGFYIFAAFVLNLLFLEEPHRREHNARPPLRQLFDSTITKAMIVYSWTMLLGIAHGMYPFLVIGASTVTNSRGRV